MVPGMLEITLGNKATNADYSVYMVANATMVLVDLHWSPKSFCPK
jgi:hypothetical protein